MEIRTSAAAGWTARALSACWRFLVSLAFHVIWYPLLTILGIVLTPLGFLRIDLVSVMHLKARAKYYESLGLTPPMELRKLPETETLSYREQQQRSGTLARCIIWSVVSCVLFLILYSGLGGENVRGGLAVWFAGATSSPPEADSGNALLERIEEPTIELGLRLIPVVSFTMGTPEHEKGRQGDEHLHEVTVSRPFYLSETEITQGQWEAVMWSNPSLTRSRRWGRVMEGEPCADYGVGGDLPVTCITWFDAIEFCNELSKLAGFEPAYTIDGHDITWSVGASGYRLPTESEWELAARAGAEFSFGESERFDRVCGSANVFDADTEVGAVTEGVPAACSDGFPGLAPVGVLAANPWGIHDLMGNVWEWTWDLKGRYPSVPAMDPVGPEDGKNRTLRGGSWRDGEASSRVGNRNAEDPSSQSPFVGFRIARQATEEVNH